jgi:hypothetical protein
MANVDEKPTIKTPAPTPPDEDKQDELTEEELNRVGGGAAPPSTGGPIMPVDQNS